MRRFLKAFPRLNRRNFQITSTATVDYNCIAWTLEDQKQWWWPDAAQAYYWPATIPREETLEAFKLLYTEFGYEECLTPILEEGWQKVAIFVNDVGKPIHASRQLANGLWTSKCGTGEDIQHELAGLEGPYGRAVCFMRRKIIES